MGCFPTRLAAVVSLAVLWSSPARAQAIDLIVSTSDAPNDITLGHGNVTYSVFVFANGQAMATSVALTISLPAASTYVSATASGGGTCTNVGGDQVSCAWGLVFGKSGATATIVVTPGVGGTNTLIASVDADQSDPNPGNNTRSETTTVNSTIDLQVTAITDNPTDITLGLGNVTYTIALNNASTSNATNTVLTANLPASSTFVSASATLGGACVHSTSVTCNWSTHEASTTPSVTVVVTPGAEGTNTLTASYAGDQGDPNTADNSDAETTTVNGTIDLQITDITDSPAEIVLGQGNVTYTVTVYNGSSSKATNTRLGVDISQSSAYVSASATHGGTCGNSSPGVVTCDWATHDALASHTATIVITPGQVSPDGINGVSAGYYGYDQADPDYANNDDSENTTVTTTPSEPAITGITPGPGQLSVSFTPGSTGGSPLTNYEYSIDAGANFTARSPASTVSPLVITGLTSGTTYPVSLRAVNANGAGDDTAPVNGTPCEANQVVTSIGDDGAGSLRQALLLACPGDTITFGIPGAGPHIITLTSGQLEIGKNLTIAGPGANLLTVQRSTAAGTPEFRIFNILSGLIVTISGLTMSNGLVSATDPGLGGVGGAILSFGSSVTIDSCTIAGNTARLGGGVANASPSLTRMTIVNSTVSGNTALGMDLGPALAAGGGGVFNFGASWLTLSGSTVSGNMSGGNGGAIDSYGSAIALVTIYGSALVDNIATGDGGAIHFEQTTAGQPALVVTNSTISGNRANGSGGGVDIDITAGAISSVELGHATITNNRADADTDGSGTGGGLRTAAPASPRLRNTIVARNFVGGTGSTADDVHATLDALSANTLIGDGTGMTGITDGISGHQIGTAASPIDARLEALANNGGPTVTHALLSDSPALDAGTDLLVTTLDDAMDASTTALPTSTALSSLALVSVGFTFQIDDEQMVITHVGVESGLAISVTRGANGTTPAAHASGASLLVASDQRGPAYARVLDSADANLTRTPDIGAVEQNPTVENIPNKTTPEDTPLSFAFNVGEGAKVDSVVASSKTQSVVATAGLSVTGSGPTRTLELTPVANVVGTATLSVTATTTTGGVARTHSDTFEVTVTSVNDRPTLDPIADLTIPENAGVQTVPLGGITAGPNETQTISINASSDRPTFVPHPTVTYTSANPTGSLSFKSAEHAFGTAIITVSIGDNGGTANGGVATFMRIFTVTVNPVAATPSVSDTSTLAQVQTSTGLVITRHLSDGTEVTHFKISAIANGTLFHSDGSTPIAENAFITVDQGGAGLRFTPATGFAGTASFQVQGAVDAIGSGLSPPATASITVNKHTTGTIIISDLPDASDHSQSVVVRYAVVNTSGGPTPTGDVEVRISGGNETCTGTVAAGQCTVTFGGAGARTILATYAGDAVSNGSSDDEPHTVNTCDLTPVVTTTEDSGAGSLREAMAVACTTATITFAIPGSRPLIIGLTSGTLTIAKNLTITGPGPDVVIVKRISGAFRIFTIDPGLTVTIENLAIESGSAGAPEYGGGIFAYNSAVTVRNSRISGNQAYFGGGIAVVGEFAAASLTLVKSTVSGNHGEIGGGLFSIGISGTATIAITNSTISGNTAATSGGGFRIHQFSAVTITHSTFTNNRCDTNNSGFDTGGGLYTFAAGHSVTLRNTIVAGNFRGSSPSTTSDDITGGPTFGSGSGYNLIGVDTNLSGTAPGFDNNLIGTAGSPLDPRLGALASNGGSTASHALLFDSPALDAGTAATDPITLTAIATDQRAQPRPVDNANLANAGNGSDIGAYEAPAPPSTPDLQAGSDLGSSATDNVTADNTPTFDVGGVTPGATVDLLVDDVVVASGVAAGTTIVLTAPTIANGVHTIQAQQTVNGGLSPRSPGLSVSIDVTAPTVTINQAAGQSDPAMGATTVNFTAVFSEAIAPATFTTADIALSGTAIPAAAAIAQVAPMDGTTFTVAVTGMTALPGSVIASIPLNAVTDIAGNLSAASSSTDNTVTVYPCPFNPVVTSTADSGAGSLREALTLACPGDTIGFALGGGSNTIQLLSSLTVDVDVTISGPSAQQLAVEGLDAFPVFVMSAGRTVTLAGIRISRGGGLLGGGVSNAGNLSVLYSTISGNAANQGGGIASVAPATLTVLFTTFRNNVAEGTGGAIYSTGTLVAGNTTISGNSSNGNAGGLFSSGLATITNATVVNNRANADGGVAGTGGGISSVGVLSLRNTLVAKNTRFDVDQDAFVSDDVAGSVNAGSSVNNLIGDGTALAGLTHRTNGNLVGTSASPIDPRVGALAFDGGFSDTIPLLAGSPALDAGDNGAATAGGLLFDQRGLVRVEDGPDANTTDTVDIGAVEMHASLALLADQAIAEDGALTLPFAVGDAALLTSVTATSGDTTLVPNTPGNVSVTGSGATRSLSVAPVPNRFGSTLVTLTASASIDSLVVQTMTETLLVTVNPVGDAPIVTGATTRVNQQTTSGLVIMPNTADGAEVTHFTITNITNGTLFKTNGSTPILEGGFITIAEGSTGVKFTPAPNSVSPGSFTVQAGTDGAGAGLGAASLATITIIKHDTTTAFVSDTPDGSEQHEEVRLVFDALSTTGGPTLTGTVTVTISGGPETCTGPLDGTGRGECLITLTEVGLPRTLTAVYNGDAFSNASSVNGTEPHSVTACAVNPPVTSNADDGPGSLRQALLDACPNSTLDLSGVTSPIGLTSGTLTLAKNVTIAGPGAGLLTIERTSGAFGIFHVNFERTVTIEGVTIANGEIPGVGSGGGIHNFGGTLTLRNSEIVGSSAFSGGAIFTGQFGSSPASTTIVNSTLRGNTAAGGGGAILHNGGFVASSTLTIVNSTISGNTAGRHGGGIANASTGTSGLSPLTIISSTIADNTASTSSGDGAGGGLYTESDPVVLANTIVAANHGRLGPEDVAGVLDTAGSFNNLIGVDTSMTGVTHGSNGNLVGATGSPIDPRLAALALNGGGTWTHALLPGSPALDAGDNALVTAPPLPVTSPIADQRGAGFTRIVDAADADAVATVDIGAYEANPSLERIADKTTVEDTPIAFAFRVGDAAPAFDSIAGTSDNTTLVPNGNIEVTGSGSTRTLTVTPAADQVGATTITVTATKTVNGTAVSMAATFTLTVSGVNDPPTLNPIANPGAILEDAGQQTIGLTGITPGPGGEVGAVTVTATSDNTALIPHPAVSYSSPGATGSLSYMPVANASGSAIITVTVTDESGGAGSVSRTFTVNVTPVNDAPVLNAIADPAAIAEDAGTQTVGFGGVATGAGESQSLTVTASSNNTSLIPHPTVTYTSPGAAGSISYLPVANAFGTATITVTVTEDGGTANGGVNTVSRTFAVFVHPIADAPGMTGATTPEDTQTTSGLVIARHGADGAEVTHFRVTAITNGTLFTSNGVTPIGAGDVITAAEGAAGVTLMPPANFFGTAEVTVQALTSSDGAGASALTTAVVTVNPVADTPSVTRTVTSFNTQSTSGLVLSLNAADGDEVTHFKITGITGGILFQHDGTTPIADGDFITVTDGAAGLRFTPATDSSATGHFTARASLSASDAGLGGDPVTATIGVRLAAPVVTNVTPGNGSLIVTFTPPALHGGSPITNYDFSLDDGANWTMRVPHATTSPLEIAGLVNGTAYTVRVRALNVEGAGAASNSITGMPRTVPGAPTIVNLTSGEGSISVAFAPPTTDGGAPITTYEYSLDNGGSWAPRVPAGVTSPILITGLQSGPAYVIRLRAVNLAGAGAMSAAMSGFATVKTAQVISFAAIADQPFTAGPLTLFAIATSGLPVSFTASGVCTIAGNVLTFVSTGACTVTASQDGNTAYHPAPGVLRGFTIAPVYTVAPTTIAAAQPAGNTDVVVTAAPANAVWTAWSNALWLTATPLAADGASHVSLAWTANPAAEARTGTATIAGVDVSVTQAGCTATATPASLIVSAAGATGTIALSIGLACEWTAASDQAWLTVSPVSGTGPASIAYQIAAHAGAADRTATLTIGGQPVSVTQQGRTPTTPGAPGAPSDLAASVSGATVTLSWQPPATGDAPTGYAIEIGRLPGTVNLGTIDTGLRTTWVYDNVPDGTYYLRVRARNGAGPGPVSNEVAVTVGSIPPPGPPTPGPGPTPPGPPGPTPAPAAPIDVTGTIADGVLTLTWTAGSGGGDVTGHIVEAGTAPGLADIGAPVIGAGRTFQFTGIPPGRYFFRVRALNGPVPSDPSNELELTYGLPGSPRTLAVRWLDAMVVLTWGPPASGGTVLSYVLEVGTAPGAANLFSLHVPAAPTMFTYDGVPAGFSFYVRVRAMTEGGLGPPSNEVVVRR